MYCGRGQVPLACVQNKTVRAVLAALDKAREEAEQQMAAQHKQPQQHEHGQNQLPPQLLQANVDDHLHNPQFEAQHAQQAQTQTQQQGEVPANQDLLFGAKLPDSARAIHEAEVVYSIFDMYVWFCRRFGDDVFIDSAVAVELRDQTAALIDRALERLSHTKPRDFMSMRDRKKRQQQRGKGSGYRGQQSFGHGQQQQQRHVGMAARH